MYSCWNCFFLSRQTFGSENMQISNLFCQDRFKMTIQYLLNRGDGDVWKHFKYLLSSSNVLLKLISAFEKFQWMLRYLLLKIIFFAWNFKSSILLKSFFMYNFLWFPYERRSTREQISFKKQHNTFKFKRHVSTFIKPSSVLSEGNYNCMVIYKRFQKYKLN